MDMLISFFALADAFLKTIAPFFLFGGLSTVMIAGVLKKGWIAIVGLLSAVIGLLMWWVGVIVPIVILVILMGILFGRGIMYIGDDFG